MPHRDTHLHVVVMAGGSGTRFWPVSRQHHPKQLVALSEDGSLLTATCRRVRQLAPPERQWLVVGQAHAKACHDAVPELPKNHVLVEPRGRNTAPAVALAALQLHAQDPNAVMAVLPADQNVRNTERFCAALERAAQHAAEHGSIALLGIRPDRPETGFGYIEQGAPCSDGVFEVARFCEKPNRERAEVFLAAGNYAWNAGIFVMRVATYLEELRTHMPALYDAMLPLGEVLDEPLYEHRLQEIYARIDATSVDYGILERTRRAVVVPCDCGWSDVGAWNSLHTVKTPNAQGNLSFGRAIKIDAKNCTTYATDGHVVAVVGLEGVTVVHTPDATLVLPSERAQDVRDVYAELSARNWTEYT